MADFRAARIAEGGEQRGHDQPGARRARWSYRREVTHSCGATPRSDKRRSKAHAGRTASSTASAPGRRGDAAHWADGKNGESSGKPGPRVHHNSRTTRDRENEIGRAHG